MDLKIEGRNIEMDDRWREEIEERADELYALHPGVTHARVTLSRDSHHQKGDHVAQAHIVVTVPKRHTLTARKEAPTFEEAIRSAFTAMRAELRRFEDKRATLPPS